MSRATGSTLTAAKKWLETQDPYTLHRRVKRHYKTDKILVSGLDDQWEADLVDVSAISDQNNGVKFLLTVIDSLSKFAWVIPLKNKMNKTVADAFTAIFKRSKRIPRKCRTDRGTEFLGGQVQSLFKSKDVIFFTADNDSKASIIERFNRTLRERLWRYFTATGREKYVDVLADIVEAYNGRVHRTTGKAPADVNVHNAEDVWRRMYGSLLKKNRQQKKIPSFKIGDTVRIGKSKSTFEKGYKTNFIKELFTVSGVIRRNLPRYKLTDGDGEIIKGTFSQAEIQRVKPHRKQVKSVVKRTGNKIAVTWRGYPDKLITWTEVGEGKRKR